MDTDLEGPIAAPETAADPPGAGSPRRDRRWFLAAMTGGLAGAVTAGAIGALVDDGSGGSSTAATSTSTTTGATVQAASDTSVTSVGAVLAVAQPSVVAIDFDTTEQYGPFSVQGTGAGSGLVISTDGLVLTNDHVVSGASNIKVTLSDGTTLDASVLGSDSAHDIALLQLEGGTGLTAATLGSSDALRVGDDVVAIGNALDLEGTPTVTKGIVSAKDRSLSSTDGTTLDHLIQTDAAINSGNSGGPLLDMTGAVVGINTAIIQDSENLGFSISIDSIKPLIDGLRSGTAS